MATIYVDPLNGTDNADAGRGETEGTGSVSGAGAYASISYALANYGSFSTTDLNIIYLADTAADVLSSSIDADTTVAKAASPLCIVGYHYDGSNGGTAGALTATLPWGETISCGEIDGNDAVSSLFDANTFYTSLQNLKMHSTTGAVVGISTGSGISRCEVYNGGTSYTLNGSTQSSVDHSYIHTDAASGVGCNNMGRVTGCEISGGDVGIQWNFNNGICRDNLIYDVDLAGIRFVADQMYITNNTIDGTGSDATSYGIQNLSNSSLYEYCTIVNNLITNFDGASAKGIYFPSGTTNYIFGNNAYYNNTTDEDVPAAGTDLAKVSESSDPYTNQAGGDYSLVSGANSNDAGVFTQHTSNIGAWQEKPTGGGGGGETTSVFMA